MSGETSQPLVEYTFGTVAVLQNILIEDGNSKKQFRVVTRTLFARLKNIAGQTVLAVCNGSLCEPLQGGQPSRGKSDRLLEGGQSMCGLILLEQKTSKAHLGACGFRCQCGRRAQGAFLQVGTLGPRSRSGSTQAQVQGPVGETGARSFGRLFQQAGDFHADGVRRRNASRLDPFGKNLQTLAHGERFGGLGLQAQIGLVMGDRLFRVEAVCIQQGGQIDLRDGKGGVEDNRLLEKFTHFAGGGTGLTPHQGQGIQHPRMTRTGQGLFEQGAGRCSVLLAQGDIGKHLQRLRAARISGVSTTKRLAGFGKFLFLQVQLPPVVVRRKRRRIKSCGFLKRFRCLDGIPQMSPHKSQRIPGGGVFDGVRRGAQSFFELGLGPGVVSRLQKLDSAEDSFFRRTPASAQQREG